MEGKIIVIRQKIKAPKFKIIIKQSKTIGATLEIIRCCGFGLWWCCAAEDFCCIDFLLFPKQETKAI